MNETVTDIIMTKYASIARNRDYAARDLLETYVLLGKQIEDLARMDKVLDNIRLEVLPEAPKEGSCIRA